MSKVHCNSCVIRQGWLFAHLEHDDVDLLTQLAQPINFGRRQIIYNEGDSASKLLTVTSGVVKKTRISFDGRVQVLGLVYPGQMLGTEGLFQKEYETGAESLSQVTLCSLPRERVLRAAQERPMFMMRLFEAMHSELRDARAQIQEMGKTSAEGKICALLCDLQPHLQNDDVEGEESFPLAHQDLAEILGLSRETISRAVGGLAKQGVVSISRQRFQVHDIDRLRELAR